MLLPFHSPHPSAMRRLTKWLTYIGGRCSCHLDRSVRGRPNSPASADGLAADCLPAARLHSISTTRGGW